MKPEANPRHDTTRGGSAGMGRLAPAFTLVEILAAMLITSVLVFGGATVLRKTQEAWKTIEAERTVHQDWRTLADVLRTELAGLYVPPTPTEATGASQTPVPQAFDLDCPSPEESILSFYTLSPCWRGTIVCARPARVTYRFVRDPLEGVRSLTRYEQPYAGEQAIGEVTEEVILKGLTDWRCWAADPNGLEPTHEGPWTEVYKSGTIAPLALRIEGKWLLGHDGERSLDAALPIPARLAISRRPDPNDAKSPEELKTPPSPGDGGNQGQSSSGAVSK